jgi:hypothetical protein
MNLRWVHAVLILLSAALAVLFGVWLYRQGNGSENLLGAGAAFVVAGGLVAYDSWFLRKTRMLR